MGLHLLDMQGSLQKVRKLRMHCLPDSLGGDWPCELTANTRNSYSAPLSRPSTWADVSGALAAVVKPCTDEVREVRV